MSSFEYDQRPTVKSAMSHLSPDTPVLDNLDLGDFQKEKVKRYVGNWTKKKFEFTLGGSAFGKEQILGNVIFNQMVDRRGYTDNRDIRRMIKTQEARTGQELGYRYSSTASALWVCNQEGIVTKKPGTLETLDFLKVDKRHAELVWTDAERTPQPHVQEIEQVLFAYPKLPLGFQLLKEAVDQAKKDDSLVVSALCVLTDKDTRESAVGTRESTSEGATLAESIKAARKHNIILEVDPKAPKSTLVSSYGNRKTMEDCIEAANEHADEIQDELRRYYPFLPAFTKDQLAEDEELWFIVQRWRMHHILTHEIGMEEEHFFIAENRFIPDFKIPFKRKFLEQFMIVQPGIPLTKAA